MKGVNIVCVPASDAPFCAMVESVLRRLPTGSTAADLQRELRRVYPRAVVRPIGRLGPLGDAPSTRYAYRDVDVADASDDEWASDNIAEGAFDDTGVYREANDLLCELFGVESADAIVGHDWSEFVTPGSAEAADELWADMVRAGIAIRDAGIASTYHVARPQGTVIEIEYRTAWDPGSRLFRTRMRPARVARG